MASQPCKDCSEKTLTQSDLRVWVQPGGAGPNNPVYLAGVGTPEVKITGAKKVLRGAKDPINYHSPRTRGKFVNRGYTVTPPGNNELTLVFKERTCAGIPLAELADCGMTLYEVPVCCNDITTFDAFKGNMLVYPNLDFESLDYGDRTDPEGNGQIEITIPSITDQPFRIAELTATLLATVTTAAGTGNRVSDMVYADNESCGDCGIKLDCAERWYALTENGTIVYRLNNQTPVVFTAPIPGWPVNPAAQVKHIAIMDGYLYASNTAGLPTGTYFYNILNADGSPSATWTQVPNAWNSMRQFKRDGSNLYAIGNASTTNIPTIWQMNSGVATQIGQIDQTITFLPFELDMCGSTFVVVGSAAPFFSLSLDSGVTWTPLTASPFGAATVAFSVSFRNSNEIWVATGTGDNLWYTTDNGVSWVNANKFAVTAANAIRDMVWINDHVGFFADTIFGTSASTKLLYSNNGGYTITAANTRVQGLPAFAFWDIDTLIVPCCTNVNKRVNKLAVIGSLSGTTGAIYELRGF